MAANSNFAVAVHSLSALAYLDRQASSDQIAASVQTNPVVVRRVMSRLAKAKLVRSIAGKHGGFELAQRPDRITLLEVLRAVDEQSLFRIHANQENPVCPVSCQIKDVLAKLFGRVDDAVARELRSTRLSDILADIS